MSCRSCGGSGKKWIERKVKEYRVIGGYDWVTKTIDVPCRACGGSGIDDRFYSVRCERCNTEIIYPRDAQTAPKYCKDCKERIKEEKNAKWREKSCSQCHAAIRYNVDWNKIPDFCPDCQKQAKARRVEQAAKWREKRCEKCSNIIKYRVDWNNIPDICHQCREQVYKERQQKPGYWDINKVLPGSRRSAADLGAKGATVLSSNKSWNKGGYHVTVFFEDGQRQSWDVEANGEVVQGSTHYSEGNKQVNKYIHNYKK